MRIERCCVNGCDSPTLNRGWCSKHYQRWLAHGDPTKVLLRQTPRGKIDEWIKTVAIPYSDDDECLTWPFSISGNGYGKLWVKGRLVVASRHICSLVNGDPPDPSYDAAHSCGKGHEGCVNPKHLSWKTKSENQSDRHIHGTSNSGSKHGMAKLSEKQVLEMRSLSNSVSWDDLALKYNVTRNTVSLIARRKIWTHI